MSDFTLGVTSAQSDSLIDDYDDPFEPLSVNSSIPTFDIGVNGGVDTLFSRIPNSGKPQ